MINIINKGVYSVLLLQNWVFSKNVSKREKRYAVKADERTVQKVLPYAEAVELEKEQEYRIKPQDREWLVPTNIRLEGTYETWDEAKFISKKLNKSFMHLEQDGTLKTRDWIIQINTHEDKPLPTTPLYSNGVSSVSHHLDELAEIATVRLEGFLISTGSEDRKPEFETFKEFVMYREGLYGTPITKARV